VADWRIRDSGGFAINRNSHFFTFIVKAASVTSHRRVCCYNISGELVYITYILWRFVGEVPLPRWYWYYSSLFTDNFICSSFLWSIIWTLYKWCIYKY